MTEKIKILLEAKKNGLAKFTYKKDEKNEAHSSLTIEVKKFNQYTGAEESPENIVFEKIRLLALIQQSDEIIADWAARKEQALAMLEQFKEEDIEDIIKEDLIK